MASESPNSIYYRKYGLLLDAEEVLSDHGYAVDGSAVNDRFIIRDEAVNSLPGYRESDARGVWIKAVKSSFAHMPHAEMDLVSDLVFEQVNENHCVPILNFFEDQRTPGIYYIVTDHPEIYTTISFGTVYSVLDFMYQILEGMVYLHGKEVAHCVLTRRNIALNYGSDSTTRFSEPITAPNGNRYYRRFGITEFGKSVRSSEANPLSLDEIPQTLLAVCPYVPENVYPASPCNPFKLDVYALGWIFAKDILEKYLGFEFLADLIYGMTAPDPNCRPTMAQAFSDFKGIVSAVVNGSLYKK